MSAYGLLDEVSQWPSDLMPDFPFIGAYLNMIPALLIEMRQNQGFARAIPRLSRGLCKQDDREDEDVVEDMLLCDKAESRGNVNFLSWESHNAQALMISTMLSWSKADIQRVVGIFNHFIQTFGSECGTSPQDTKARIAEVLIEHVRSLQAYAGQIADVHRAPRAVKVGEPVPATSRLDDEAVLSLVTIRKGGELAEAIEALRRADKKYLHR